ncbi:MAG: hypothetical protein V4602_14250 [Pseudomonadota bacterium]
MPVAAHSLQLQGDLDLLLRSLEDEYRPQMFSEALDSSGLEFISHYQKMLSEQWVTGIYEVLRAFRQRDREAKKRNAELSGLSDDETFTSILSDLELLRMPISKYEIAKDTKLEEPLLLAAYLTNGDATDNYIYDKDDPTRSHIMQAGISGRGSFTWLALDHLDSSQRWIERRELSDRLLIFGRSVVPAGILESQRATSIP